MALSESARRLPMLVAGQAHLPAVRANRRSGRTRVPAAVPRSASGDRNRRTTVCRPDEKDVAANETRGESGDLEIEKQDQNDRDRTENLDVRSVLQVPLPGR